MAYHDPQEYDNEDLIKLQKLINRYNELIHKPRPLVQDEDFIETKLDNIAQNLRDTFGFQDYHFLMIETEKRTAHSLANTFDEIDDHIEYEGEE